MLVAWSIAATTAFYGVFELVSSQADLVNTTASFLTAVSAFFGGLALLPSVGLSLGRLLNRPALDGKPFPSLIALLPRIALILVPFSILLGSWVAGSRNYAWLLLPPAHILTVGLLLIGLLWLSLHRLQAGSFQSLMGAFATGLTLSPALAFLLEAIAMVIFTITGVIYLSTQPQLLERFQQLLHANTGNLVFSTSPLQAVEALLSDPVILILVLSYLSLVVPIIEELLKPLGVWLLLGRDLTPAQGFALGTLGGAGFGLFENLTLGATPVDWTLTNVLRIGATALHMTTGGLMGWAIVRAKRERRYVQLLATYLAAIILHGLWNAMAIAFSRQEITAFAESARAFLSSPPILVIGMLTVLCFAILITNNRELRRQQARPPSD